VANLAGLPVRYAWLPLAAVGSQLALVFFTHSDTGVSSFSRVGVLLATYGGLIGFLLLNRRLPGAGFLLLGAGLNAAVMAANGGYMPITPEALARSGHEGQIVTRDGSLFVYGSKDIVLEAEDTRLGFLSDVFGIPEELPFSATFSLGDVLIGLGAAVMIAGGMGRGQLVAGAPRPEAGSPRKIRGQAGSRKPEAGSWKPPQDPGAGRKLEAILRSRAGSVTDN
jgi:hypothetical protein